MLFAVVGAASQHGQHCRRHRGDGEALRLLLSGSAHVYPLRLLCPCCRCFPHERMCLSGLTLALLAPCGRGLHHRSAVAGSGRHAAIVAINRDSIMMVVAVWHHHQPLSVFLASRAGDGRFAQRARTWRGDQRRALRGYLSRIRWDTYVGMGFSNLIAFSSSLSAAAAAASCGRHRHPDLGAGRRGVASARRQFRLSAVQPGHHRHRHVCVPVLAGLAAYAVVESFDWKSGLDKSCTKRKEFYGIIASPPPSAALPNFTPIDRSTALYWSHRHQRRHRAFTDHGDDAARQQSKVAARHRPPADAGSWLATLVAMFDDMTGDATEHRMFGGDDASGTRCTKVTAGTIVEPSLSPAREHWPLGESSADLMTGNIIVVGSELERTFIDDCRKTYASGRSCRDHCGCRNTVPAIRRLPISRSE